MPSDAIYLISDSGGLQRIEHQLYANEDILQQLIAQHPEVIAGDQISPHAPSRWLLIRREAAIPAEAEGADRWWLDHLLLDQNGIPTLVEVKRSSDTRIRREVIGQMLDYVANAQAYWAAGRMREMLEAESGSAEAADARLSEFLGISPDPETSPEEISRFWQTVETNMRKGDVRLLFVADELPRELRRLIEFLNEQFTNIEVLGVELRQYVGQGIKALVPRVIGQTEAAREQKQRSAPARPAGAAKIDREAFLAAVGSTSEFFSKLFAEADVRGLSISFGRKGFSVRAPNRPIFFYCYPPLANGRSASEIEIFLRDLDDPAQAKEIRECFQRMPFMEAAGKFTLRSPVADRTLSESKRIVDVAFDFMARQERS